MQRTGITTRTGITSVCIIAALAVSATTAWAASAAFKEEPPEFGQCLPKPFNGVGNWKDAGCTVPKGPSPSEHRYEWYPGFGENAAHDPVRLITKPRFISKIRVGTTAVFEVDDTYKVTCTGETARGEITGPKTVGRLLATFTGCTEVSGNGCQSTGQASRTIATNALKGELGVLKEFPKEPVRNALGLVLFIQGVEFECGGISLAVRGSVIHPLVANAMKRTSTEQFTGTKGDQKPEGFALLGRTANETPAFLAFAAAENVLETAIAGGQFVESCLLLAAGERNEMKVQVSSVS